VTRVFGGLCGVRSVGRSDFSIPNDQFPVCRQLAFPRTAIAAAYQDPQSVTTTRFARPAGAPHSFQEVFLHVRQLRERSLDKNPASIGDQFARHVDDCSKAPIDGTSIRASLTPSNHESTTRDPIVRANLGVLEP
jgi:hypothetical protein